MKRRRRTCARAPGPRVGVRTADRRELEARRAVLAAVDAPQLYLRLLEHEHVPAAARDQIREFEWDWSTVKIDWTLDGTIQWEASEARRAPVAHVTDSVDALTVQSSQLRMGLVPEQPFLIFGQYSMIDPSRIAAPPSRTSATRARIQVDELQSVLERNAREFAGGILGHPRRSALDRSGGGRPRAAGSCRGVGVRTDGRASCRDHRGVRRG